MPGRVLLAAAAALSAGTIAVAIILRGADREAVAIEAARDTAERSLNFLHRHDRQVCAARPPARSGKQVFQTYPSVQAARGEGGARVAHCGACGRCSNMHDMTVLAETTHSLTDDATWCSMRGYIASLFLWRGVDVYRRVAEECMLANVGFTQPCLECWLDDMVTSIQSCVFTCLKSQYILFEPKNGEDGQLSSCLECDELLAGPAFMECSGSNRRRMAIHSDIGRDSEKELCRYVDMDWDATKTATSSQLPSSDSAKKTEL